MQVLACYIHTTLRHASFHTLRCVLVAARHSTHRCSMERSDRLKLRDLYSCTHLHAQSQQITTPIFNLQSRLPRLVTQCDHVHATCQLRTKVVRLVCICDFARRAGEVESIIFCVIVHVTFGSDLLRRPAINLFMSTLHRLLTTHPPKDPRIPLSLVIQPPCMHLDPSSHARG